jgi:hypothetical protein
LLENNRERIARVCIRCDIFAYRDGFALLPVKIAFYFGWILNENQARTKDARNAQKVTNAGAYQLLYF